MTKFSDFIRMPGTAGPPTKEGIRNLGFALLTDFPTQLAGLVSVLVAQTFTTGQKLQGRQNLGLGTISTQDATTVAITGGTITGITDLAVIDGGTGASTAAAARTNLGLGNVDNTSDANKPLSTAQATAIALKANSASPALTGTPTAPTAAPGTNTTQIATTAFVAAAVASPFTKEFISAQQTVTLGALLTLAHGLGAVPKFVTLDAICTTADLGYSVGDLVAVTVTGDNTATGNGVGVALYRDATNINIRVGNFGFAQILNKGTGAAGTNATPANWRFIARAWA